MGMFDQFKMAADMMKNMDPQQLQQMMEQAKESQKMLGDQIRKVVDEEISRRNLISRDEVQRMINERR